LLAGDFSWWTPAFVGVEGEESGSVGIRATIWRVRSVEIQIESARKHATMSRMPAAALKTRPHTFDGGLTLVAMNNLAVTESLKNVSNSTGRSGTPLATASWVRFGSKVGNNSSNRDR
jgi:hypothetical protein